MQFSENGNVVRVLSIYEAITAFTALKLMQIENLTFPDGLNTKINAK